MTGTGDDPGGVRPRSKAVKEAWARTNEDMEAIAEQRREQGWEVVAVPAVHTSPVGREQGDDERFGLVHVVPDNHAGAFSEAVEGGTFPRYEAYRNEVGEYVYLVTELLDPDSRTAVLVAGQYDLRRARGMIRSANDEGVVYTHARTLDGTVLGSFRHEEVEPLVPDVERAGGTADPDPDEG